MSDYYINKSALLEQFFKDTPHCQYVGVKYVDNLIKDFPTVDEKEIIRKPFERVVERLEEKQIEYEKISEQKYFDMPQACYYKGYEEGYKGAIEIVKEECGINE